MLAQIKRCQKRLNLLCTGLQRCRAVTSPDPNLLLHVPTAGRSPVETMYTKPNQEMGLMNLWPIVVYFTVQYSIIEYNI